MSQTTRRLAVFVAVLFFALLANLNRVQFVRANELADKPGNTRALIKEYANERGPILVGGAPIASSKATDARLKYQRVYAAGPEFAAATGFYSLLYGRTGIERTNNEVLAGTDPRFAVQRLGDLLSGRTRKGGSVLLTIDPAAQKAAWQGMQGKRGAVVAIQPSTGAILAIVQFPSFDPNLVSSNDGNVARKAYTGYTDDPAKPLLNRPLAELYPPGSTFKIVTTAAALASGKYTTTTQIPAPASITLPGTRTTLSNYTNRQCLDGSITLAEALAISCNTAFAQVGIAVGGDALRAQAQAFGFGSPFQVPLRAATSRFPPQADPAQTAQSAIGQYDVRSTALQMAMVVAGVANRGIVMNPYLVQEQRAPDLGVLETARPTEFGRATTPEIAQIISDMMVGVVENGTGRNAAIPGVAVAGKTGTAQTSPGSPPDAWFVSFAPAADPQVAVAVVVEGAPVLGEISGGRLAAPVAKAVMEAILTR